MRTRAGTIANVADEPASGQQESRLDLLRESYKEVLDATKHTDDKIGRLLTGLAFLTAAALSLAGWQSAAIIRTTFKIEPFELPLALISLGGFLAGIIVAFLLLLAAFSTPLRLPSQFDGQRPRPPAGEQNTPGSAIYFNEIAKLSLDEWKTKMAADPQMLQRQREQSLVYEVYNLALRARSKANRISEASAVVNVALIAFLVSASFTLLAAPEAAGDDAPGPLPIRWNGALVLGAMVAAACYVQFHARLRDQGVRVHLGPPAPARQGFAVLVSLWLLAVVASAEHQQWFIAPVAVFGAAAFCLYWSLSRPTPASGDASGQPRQRRSAANVVTLALLAVIAVSATALELTPLYGWRLVVAFVGYGLLNVPSLLAASLSERRRTATPTPVVPARSATGTPPAGPTA